MAVTNMIRILRTQNGYIIQNEKLNKAVEVIEAETVAQIVLKFLLEEE